MNEQDIDRFFGVNPAVGSSVKRQEFEFMRGLVKQLYEENRGLKKKMDNVLKVLRSKGVVEFVSTLEEDKNV